MLSQVQRAHGGDYICRADNGVGRGAARETVSLEIRRKYLHTIYTHYLHTIYTLCKHYVNTIYTISTKYIYTVSTHYLQPIYTLSTHYLHARWDEMPYAYGMNKFLMLPNADHVVAGWWSRA